MPQTVLTPSNSKKEKTFSYTKKLNLFVFQYFTFRIKLNQFLPVNLSILFAKLIDKLLCENIYHLSITLLELFVSFLCFCRQRFDDVHIKCFFARTTLFRAFFLLNNVVLSVAAFVSRFSKRYNDADCRDIEFYLFGYYEKIGPDYFRNV